MNFDRPMGSVAIHSRDIASRIVKTHQPVRLFDRGEGAIDIVMRSPACNLDKRASNGRQRRISMLECNLIKCQKAFHAISNVPATQSCLH